jgi:hypothetical protein
MGIYPCDCHGGRYVGAQQTAYPALLTGTTSTRRKRRLCPNCFSELLTFCEQHMLEVGVNDDSPMDSCCVCQALETGTMAFTTMYQKSAERRDFVGRVCDACLTGTTLAFFGEQEPLLTLVA